MPDYCSIKELTGSDAVAAAARAVQINASNAPPIEAMKAIPRLSRMVDDPYSLAVLTGKYWGSKGIDLTVSFMESCPTDLADRILLHANSWNVNPKPGGPRPNMRFRRVQSGGQLRITREGQSLYSYLGTDNLQIPANRETMALGGFTMNTSEAEFRRVVPHEFGHAAGFPHEHSLPDVLALLDFEKVIAIKMRQTGWPREEVIRQILTPPPQGSYRMSANGDINGVMCYWFSAEETKSGQPIPGGKGIDDIDYAFAEETYPSAVEPPEPPEPPPPPPGSPCGTICEAFLQTTKTFNRIRHTRARVMAELTSEQQRALADARAAIGIPCEQLLGALKILCPQTAAMTQAAVNACAILTTLLTLIPKLCPVQPAGTPALAVASPPGPG